MKPLLLLGFLLSLAPWTPAAPLRVVATLPDFAALAREVGGDLVAVESLARGTEDPHYVDPKPSHVKTLNRADVLIEGGAELEIGWLPPLLTASRNPKIQPGADGFVNAAQGVRMLDVPAGGVDRSQGDVHPAGNPHYWLDPVNGKIIAAHLADTFARLDAAHAHQYRENLGRFTARLDARLAEWQKQMQPWQGTRVITYHKCFEYFAARFGLEIVAQLEPKPGIEPSPSHLNSLVPKARAQNVKLLLIEPNRPRKTAENFAKTSGLKLVILPQMTGGSERARDYLELFESNLQDIIKALKPTP